MTIDVPKLTASLTPMQEIVLGMVAEGHNYSDIAEHLGIVRATAKFHAAAAAEKIPGDLPVQMKLVLYHRLSKGRDPFTGKYL